jgi:hypothetical protein
MIAAKALRIFTRIYPVLKSERSSVGTKLTLYKALIGFILTYARLPAWEFAAESYLLKLHSLQSNVLHTTDNLPRRTRRSSLYNFVTKLCR